MSFSEKLGQVVEQTDSLLCIGIDPRMDRLPEHLRDRPDAMLEFGKRIVEATAEAVCAFKPNSAFYEASGHDGVRQLEQLCAYIKKHHPEQILILDAKRGDIDNTNSGYAINSFDNLGADALTVNPYLGIGALSPFYSERYAGKGIIVLCRTSNESAPQFQDLVIEGSGGKKLFEKVAEDVKDANASGDFMLVVGATYPKELAALRQAVGDEMWFLVPGIGTQGGDTEKAVKAGINIQGEGIIVNSSSDIIYASGGRDFAQAALKRAIQVRDEINLIRRAA